MIEWLALKIHLLSIKKNGCKIKIPSGQGEDPKRSNSRSVVKPTNPEKDMIR
jgi:hypothetical protein